MEKIRINKPVVKALLWFGALVWLFWIMIILPNFKDLMALHDPSNFGVTQYRLDAVLYNAWHFPLVFLVISLIHTKWSVLFPVTVYYSIWLVDALGVIVDIIRGDFIPALMFFIGALGFGAAIYFFSLVSLRIIHNNMFIKNDHYLVRWAGAVKMPLGEYWQWLLAAYAFYLIVTLFAG